MADLEPVWEYRTDDNVWSVCLSKDSQVMVLGSWDSIAYALDRSGELIWRHTTSDYVKGIGISDDGELTVVGSYDRYIYAIKSSGKLAWRYKTENYVRAVGVSASGEYVAAGSWRGTVYYLDKRGKLLWKHRVDSPVLDMDVSADGGLVVAGCEDGSVYAFDSGGNDKWTHKAGGTITDVAVSSTGDKTMVAAKDTILVCLGSDGEERWKFHLGGSSKGLRLILGDTLTVAFTDNNFVQYVDSSGSLIFMRRLPVDIWEGSVADDGITVAVATKDNRSQLFENTDLAQVVLETSQLTLEKVSSDNVDISEAQDIHRHASELISDGQHGEAIRLALEAQALARKTHSSTLGDRARNLMDEVSSMVDENDALDMRKAKRYLEKARRDLDANKIERVIFYGQQAKVAAEETIDKGTPAADEDLFASRIGKPIEVDDSAVDKLLSTEGQYEVQEMPKFPEDEPEPGLADDLADEIGEEVAEMDGSVVDEDQEAAMEDLDDELEDTSSEEFAGSEDGRPEVLEDMTDEVPEDLSTDDEEVEEVEEGEEDLDETDDEVHDVCSRCGELAWDEESGECLSCISDAVMTFAVNEAKVAHKDGSDISSLTSDLKAAKQARQEKDFGEVIAVSERIIDQLEQILNRDIQGELAQLKADKRRKKKKWAR